MGIQHVLIIDDEPDIRELLEITLGRMKLHTHSAASVREAKALLGSETFDLCLTDMRLPDGDGIELVEHIQAYHPCLPVAVITAYGSMDTAVQALKSGAFDFVSKPVDLTTLRDLVSSALKLSAPPTMPSVDRTQDTAQGDDHLLGDAPAMRKLKATIAKLARSQAPVYILGESGSGKERVAQEIHRLGPRAERPFVPVNCGAIPAELMESEFFGHIKGSFTGAVTDKQGLFQAAQGGTLFLDEVAELPLHMQVKLLRAIQERAIKPVGAAREISVDARILSASHKNLANEVESGRFRQDLYYRLNVIELKVPSLRERLEDLPRLADYILGRLAERWDEPPRCLSEAAMSQLAGYHYPGNVRELENILERAATLCDGDVIEAEDLQLPRGVESSNPGQHASRLSLEERLVHEERQVIQEALEAVGGDREQAAQRLGLSTRQLGFRLRRLGLESA